VSTMSNSTNKHDIYFFNNWDKVKSTVSIANEMMDLKLVDDERLMMALIVF